MTIVIHDQTRVGVASDAKFSESPVPASELKIAGITAFTGIDYPGLLSAVFFLQGCPWKCSYCHNPWMQPREFAEEYQHSSWDEAVKLLDKRKGLLDAVVFSGGEPCLDPALFSAMQSVKERGMKVGLHTSGAYPRRLKEVLPLVDWVGLDMKAPVDEPERFDAITQAKKSAEHFLESFTLIQEAQCPYEVRTTAHPDFLPVESLLKMAHWLHGRGVENYALQIYRDAPTVLTHYPRVGIEYPGEETEKELKLLFKNFTLRRD